DGQRATRMLLASWQRHVRAARLSRRRLEPVEDGYACLLLGDALPQLAREAAQHATVAHREGDQDVVTRLEAKPSRFVERHHSGARIGKATHQPDAIAQPTALSG